MKIRLNIVAKLALIFVLFAALLLAAVGVLSYTNGRAALQAAAVSELFSTAIEKQSSLNDWITETQTHATSLSASPYLQANVADLRAARGSGDQAAIQAVHDRLIEELQVWVGQGRDYLEWLVLDPDSGQVIASTDPGEEGKFREDQPYFINGKSSPYLQDLYYSPATQGTLLTVSAPIRSGNGTLLAVLAGNLDLVKMNTIISRRTGLRQSDDAYLINTSELFVTQPRFLSDPAILRLGVHTEAVKRCLVRNSGMVIAPDYRGIPAVIIYRWLPEHQLCLIVKMDQAEALAPAMALRNNIILISLLALMAAAGLAWWLARTITRPVQQLAEAAREIGAGKLDTPIEIKTRDEIGELAGAFVQMTENLQKTLVSRDDLLAEIAERKKAEETLHQSEEKYRHLFQNAQVGMYRSKLDGSAILAVNQKLCEIFGFSAEEMIDNPATIRWANPAARDQMVTDLRRTGTLHDYEMGILTKNGEARTCLVSISLNPELGFLEGSAIDVTERKRAQEALQKSEKRLREAQEMSHLGFWTWDVKTGAVEWSEEVFKIFCLDPKEFTPQIDSILALSPWPEDHQRDQELIQRAIETRNPGSYEQKFLRPDKSIGHYYSTFQGNYDEKGDLISIVGTVLDITERKRTEEALLESETNFRELAENAGEGVLIAAEGGVHLFANRASAEITGYSADELLHLKAQMLAYPDEAPKVMARLQKILAGEDIPNRYETAILSKKGLKIPVEISSNKTIWKGQPADIVFIVDITERKRAEEALHYSEERYRLIAENANDWIYLIAPDRTLLYISPSCERVTGYTPKEFTDNSELLNKIVHPDDRKDFESHAAESQGESGGHNQEFRILTKAGEMRWISHSCVPVHTDEGQYAGRRGTNRDITERKRAEEALNKTLADLERSNTDLEQFAYVASHDLQEPLRMVSSFTQLLAQRYKGKLDKDADEFIGYAVEGADHMQRLINDLLSYSRVGTRGKPPSPVPADSALDRALENLKLVLEESQVEVKREPLPTVTVDDVQLIQVFQNLIANAIKFRGDEPPRINISCEARGSEWVFSVRDNGIGIDPQYLERIFIIFQRLHKRGQYPGTGIGLAMCKKIIVRHGGRIWVESEPGKGSTFFFSLPKTGG